MGYEPERRSGADRRVKRHYRFHDLRGGFDRRKRYLILGTMRDHPWTLLTLLLLLNVLSILDGMLTAAELATGVAREGNPVLKDVIVNSPLGAVFFKAAVIVLVSMGIWRSRRYRPVLLLAPIALAIYTALIAYHLGSLSGFGLI